MTLLRLGLEWAINHGQQCWNLYSNLMAQFDSQPLIAQAYFMDIMPHVNVLKHEHLLDHCIIILFSSLDKIKNI